MCNKCKIQLKPQYKTIVQLENTSKPIDFTKIPVNEYHDYFKLFPFAFTQVCECNKSKKEK